MRQQAQWEISDIWLGEQWKTGPVHSYALIDFNVINSNVNC